MQAPAEVVFIELPRAAWAEAYVEKRIQRLDRLAGDAVSCHVMLGREQHSQRTGNMYRVTLNVRLPPNYDLAVTKERAIGDVRTELRALVRAAFEAMERLVKEAVQRRRGDVKAPVPDAPS